MAKSTEYRSWSMMKNRCLNKNADNYPYYGGRGIKVCKRWLDSFSNFFEDMGVKPGKGYSIERKNNSSGYFPKNCFWATKRQQANNRRVKSRKSKKED